MQLFDYKLGYFQYQVLMGEDNMHLVSDVEQWADDIGVNIIVTADSIWCKDMSDVLLVMLKWQ